MGKRQKTKASSRRKKPSHYCPNCGKRLIKFDPELPRELKDSVGTFIHGLQAEGKVVKKYCPDCFRPPI